MIYAILALLGSCLLATTLFYFFRSMELSAQLRQVAEREETYVSESKELQTRLRQAVEKENFFISELTKVEKLRHIPDVIERAKKAKAEGEARIADAQRRAEAIIERAMAEANMRAGKLQAEVEHQMEAERAEARKLLRDAEATKFEALEALRVAKSQAENAIEEAQREAREAASKARKEAKEKKDKAEAALDLATRYAQDIRKKAEERAREIDKEAYEARGKVEEYRAIAQALKNRIEGYEGVYLVPPTHVLDELAEEFGYSDVGEKLRLARERTRLMRENGTAATCGYPDGWKKDHALKFVLSTFDGKVDTILSRVKSGNQGKLIQEIKDTAALVNKDGEVYKNARIEEEYLQARLEEVKWAVAVQKLKEKAREEQRAIREQIREEERARKEAERAIKQAEREEELANKAIEKAKKQFEQAREAEQAKLEAQLKELSAKLVESERNEAIAKAMKQYEQASEAERAKLEAQLKDLTAKLVEAEEKGKKAISMAQQTKCGRVYIISNVGSFGEGVYKIGMTRRQDPNERVRELGDASVPFPFDVHAMLYSEDAPALENALHRQFVEKQVNKVNKRKEFFRVSIRELQKVVQDMGVEGTWTLAAEASQYRETLALEHAMQVDTEIRRKWLQEQAAFDSANEEYLEQDLEEVEA